MDISIFVETPRLILRHFQNTDLQAFMAYRNDPDIARYQSWEGITHAETKTFIEEQQHRKPGVPGEWLQVAIEQKGLGVLIGDCAFKILEEDIQQAEIGFSLSRAYQGQGLATEAVSAWLTYAFQVFNLHRVIAITDCENYASYRLLERLGMRREGHFIQNIYFKGKWGDEYLYAILRSEWLTR